MDKLTDKKLSEEELREIEDILAQLPKIIEELEKLDAPEKIDVNNGKESF